MNDYLVPLALPVKYLDKDYGDVKSDDCGNAGPCEVLEIAVDERPSWVTYEINSHLLPQAPDRPIWDAKDPLSCDITPQHPAQECISPMLHVLAKKVAAHNTNVHKPPL